MSHLEVKKGLVWGLYAHSFGAGDETRTRDIQLGRLALYQLSYSRLRTSLSCKGFCHPYAPLALSKVLIKFA